MVGTGLLVWLPCEAEWSEGKARAFVVTFGAWRGGRRWIAWGPRADMRCPAAEVDRAALELLTYLRKMPEMASWPVPMRDFAGVDGWRGRWRRLRAGLAARLGAARDAAAGGRW